MRPINTPISNQPKQIFLFICSVKGKEFLFSFRIYAFLKEIQTDAFERNSKFYIFLHCYPSFPHRSLLALTPPLHPFPFYPLDPDLNSTLFPAPLLYPGPPKIFVLNHQLLQTPSLRLNFWVLSHICFHHY